MWELQSPVHLIQIFTQAYIPCYAFHLYFFIFTSYLYFFLPPFPIRLICGRPVHPRPSGVKQLPHVVHTSPTSSSSSSLCGTCVTCGTYTVHVPHVVHTSPRSYSSSSLCGTCGTSSSCVTCGHTYLILILILVWYMLFMYYMGHMRYTHLFPDPHPPSFFSFSWPISPFPTSPSPSLVNFQTFGQFLQSGREARFPHLMDGTHFCHLIRKA